MQFLNCEESPSGLAEYFWPAENAMGSVVLQHGFAEYAERYATQYSQLIPRLNQAGFDVHAFDLPGHGRSPGDRRQVDIEQAVQANLAFRRLLLSDKPTFLFGHSLGGAVTAASLLRDSRNVAGVALSGPALIRLPSFLAAGVSKVASRYPAMPFKNLAPNAMTKSQEILAAVDNDPMMCRGKMPLGLIASLCRENLRTWKNAGNWSVPTLLIHGSKDKYTNPNDTKRFFEAIHSSDKTLNIIDGAFHETLNDPNGDATAAEIVNWLKNHV